MPPLWPQNLSVTYLAILITTLTAMLSADERSAPSSPQDPPPVQDSRPKAADPGRDVMTPGGEAILSAAFARLDLIPAAAGSRIVTLSQVDLAAATDPVL